MVPCEAECQPMPLSWTKRLKVALGASRGLNHLHQNKIIHKDIRPSNILLKHDFEPLVRLEYRCHILTMLTLIYYFEISC